MQYNDPEEVLGWSFETLTVRVGELVPAHRTHFSEVAVEQKFTANTLPQDVERSCAQLHSSEAGARMHMGTQKVHMGTQQGFKERDSVQDCGHFQADVDITCQLAHTVVQIATTSTGKCRCCTANT